MQLEISKNIFDARKQNAKCIDVDSLPILTQNGGISNTSNIFGHENFFIQCSKNGYDYGKSNDSYIFTTPQNNVISDYGSISEVNLTITRLKQVDDISGKTNMCYIDGMFVFPYSRCMPFLTSRNNTSSGVNTDGYHEVQGYWNTEVSRNSFYQSDTSILENSYVYLGYNGDGNRVAEKPFEESLITRNATLNRYLDGFKFKRLGSTFLNEEYNTCYKTGVIYDYQFTINEYTQGYLINSITPPYNNGTPRTFTWYDNHKYNNYTSSINYMTYLQKDKNNPLFMDNNFGTVFASHNYDIESPLNSNFGLTSFGFGEIDATATSMYYSDFLKNGTNYKYIATLNEVVYSYSRCSDYDYTKYSPYHTIITTIDSDNTRSGWFVIKNVLSTSTEFYCNDMDIQIYDYSSSRVSSDTAEITAIAPAFYTHGTNTGNGIHNDTYYNKAVMTLERKDGEIWYAIARKTKVLDKTSTYNAVTEEFPNLKDNTTYRWFVRFYVKNDSVWNLENKGYITSVLANTFSYNYRDGVPYYYGTVEFRVELATKIANSLIMKQLFIDAISECNGKIKLNFGVNNKYSLAPTYNNMNNISYIYDFNNAPTVEVVYIADNADAGKPYMYVALAYGGELIIDGSDMYENYNYPTWCELPHDNKTNSDNGSSGTLEFYLVDTNNKRYGVYQKLVRIDFFSSNNNGLTPINNYSVNYAILVPSQSANQEYKYIVVKETTNLSSNELLSTKIYNIGYRDRYEYKNWLNDNMFDIGDNNASLYFKRMTTKESEINLQTISSQSYKNETYTGYFSDDTLASDTVAFDNTTLTSVINEFGIHGIAFSRYVQTLSYNPRLVELTILSSAYQNSKPFPYEYYVGETATGGSMQTNSSLPHVKNTAEIGTIIENSCPSITQISWEYNDTNPPTNYIQYYAKMVDEQYLELRNLNSPVRTNINESPIYESSIIMYFAYVSNGSSKTTNLLSIVFRNKEDTNDYIYVDVYIDDNQSNEIQIKGYRYSGETLTETFSNATTFYNIEILDTDATEVDNSNDTIVVCWKEFNLPMFFVNSSLSAYGNNDLLGWVVQDIFIHKALVEANQKDMPLYLQRLIFSYKGELIDYTASLSSVSNVDNVENFLPFSADFDVSLVAKALALTRKESNNINDDTIDYTKFGIIGYKDLVSNEDGTYSYTLDDYFNKSNTLYRYGVCEYDIENGAVKSESIYTELVKNNSNKFVVADKTESFEFLANVSWGSLEHSSNVTYVATLNNKYPYIVDVANDNFITGNMMLDIVNDEFLDGTGYLDAHKIQEKVDAFCNFLKKKTAKVIKDWNGRSYMIYILPSTVESITTSNNLTKLSFSFVEIGDLNNEQDLEENEVLIGDNLQDILDKYNTSN